MYHSFKNTSVLLENCKQTASQDCTCYALTLATEKKIATGQQCSLSALTLVSVTFKVRQLESQHPQHTPFVWVLLK